MRTTIYCMKLLALQLYLKVKIKHNLVFKQLSVHGTKGGFMSVYITGDTHGGEGARHYASGTGSTKNS